MESDLQGVAHLHWDSDSKPAAMSDISRSGSSRASSVATLSDDTFPCQMEPALLKPPSKTTSRSILEQLDQLIEASVDDDKAAYVEAKRKAPHLVSREERLNFVKSQRFDLPKAATKILQHWTRRRALFGDKAVLPLQMSQALDEHDMEHLQTGFVRLLPSRTRDRVVIFDNMTGAASMPTETRLNRERCRFYMLYKAVQRAGKDKNIVLLRFSSSPQIDVSQLSNIQELLFLMPVETKRLSVYFLLPETGDQGTFVDLCQHMNAESLRDATRFAFASSTKDLSHQLEQQGVRVDGLPDTVGGSVTFDDFGQWLSEQQQVERQQRHDLQVASHREQMHREEKAAFRKEERQRKKLERRAQRRQEVRALQGQLSSQSVTRMRLSEEQRFIAEYLRHLRHLVPIREPVVHHVPPLGDDGTDLTLPSRVNGTASHDHSLAIARALESAHAQASVKSVQEALDRLLQAMNTPVFDPKDWPPGRRK